MTPDPNSLVDALLFWKLLGISLIVITAINGLLQIIGFFRKQPPLEDVLKRLELRWLEQDAERERALTLKLSIYQLKTEAEACTQRHNQWTGEVDRRSVHLIKESEARTVKRFDEVRQDLQAFSTTLNAMARDVAIMAVEKKKGPH
jgi:hypothetical protein